MSVMNDLLGKIVTASGGEVTSAGNRNGLLQDWLNTVGEVCVPLWQPNGVNQSLTVDSTPNDTHSINYICPPLSPGTKVLADGSLNGASVEVSNNTITHSFLVGNLVVNGVPVSSGDVTMVEGGSYKIEFVTSSIIRVGSRSDNSRYVDGAIYNFSIGDGSIYNYPLNDGFANNPTARNLGSGADGTFINNDAAAWGERCE